MNELLNSLSSDNLVLLCVIMGIVALFLAIAISIEIYNSNKKYQKLIEKNNLEKESKLENTSSKINIKESPDIKYVDESDEELEKTKAKIELANLREKLKKEEEEKQRLLEMNIALANKEQNNTSTVVEEPKKEEIEELDIEEETVEENNNVVEEPSVVVNNVTINNEVHEENNEQVTSNVQETVVEEKPIDKSLQLDEALKKVRVSTEKTQDNNKIDIKYDSDIEILDDLASDEEDAIISYEELKNAQSFGFTDEEMEKYEDEKDAIISIQELENLYLESQSIEVPVENTKEEFNKKEVVEMPEIVDSNNFHNSPAISPVYGMSKSDQELVLEQTANLEKLNEEIKKTNEFLKTLKDLKKNLE